MDIQALRKLVRQGEGQYLEFKLKSNHPEKIVKEIVAFANTEGGILLIGVSDDKHILGVKFPDEDEYLLKKAINNYCFPAIEYTLERIAIDDDSEREVLIYTIPKSSLAPHYVLIPEQDIVQKVYVRVNDRSIQASKEMRQILKESRKQKNIRFQYGEKEKILMKYLETNSLITLEKFSEIAQIPKNIASRTLILLVLANVLKILPEEAQDYFMMNMPVEEKVV